MLFSCFNGKEKTIEKHVHFFQRKFIKLPLFYRCIYTLESDKKNESIRFILNKREYFGEKLRDVDGKMSLIKYQQKAMKGCNKRQNRQ